MTLTKIVTGVDPSPLAANALRWARNLADRSDASLRVVGTWQMPLIGFVPLPLDGLPTPDFMAEQCDTMVRKMIESVQVMPDEVLCLEGKPGPTLLEASVDADLLVVGRTGQGRRHGLSRVAEVVLGSTARHCIHHSVVPVVAVPSGAEWPDNNATVVVGVDGSPNSLQALEWSLTSLPADSSLHVIRAFTPWVGDGLTPMDLVTDTAFISAFRAETHDWVEDAIKRVGSETQHLTVSVSIGRAIDALLGADVAPDLIVLGERGHTGIQAKVLGSVADHVVRFAPCPVAIVPLACAD